MRKEKLLLTLRADDAPEPQNALMRLNKSNLTLIARGYGLDGLYELTKDELVKTHRIVRTLARI